MDTILIATIFTTAILAFVRVAITWRYVRLGENEVAHFYPRVWAGRKSIRFRRKSFLYNRKKYTYKVLAVNEGETWWDVVYIDLFTYSHNDVVVRRRYLLRSRLVFSKGNDFLRLVSDMGLLWERDLSWKLREAFRSQRDKNASRFPWPENPSEFVVGIMKEFVETGGLRDYGVITVVGDFEFTAELPPLFYDIKEPVGSEIKS